MKAQSITGTPNIIAIYADDKKGLLAQILTIFNKRDYSLGCLNVSRTDIQDIILITVEVEIPDRELKTILHKIENIVEVYRALAWDAQTVSLNKIGFYRVSLQLLGGSLWALLQKHGATITKIFDESLMIQKIGTDDSLTDLYNQLDGKHLLGFCKSALIAEQSMLQLDQFFTQPDESLAANDLACVPC
jgi:acetolactate synthase-1/3 small subunit